MAAAELDEQEAAAFLDAACAGDEPLRQEVESLLAHRRTETLLVDDPAKAETDQLVRPVWNDESLETSEGTTSTHSPQDAVNQEDESERFPPGTVVAGRYRILGLLGRGGMGEVYRADDLRLEQSVALKFLARSRSADEEWLARFHGEVRLARRVTHPNVNRVYDIGEADGEVFLSMEYVDGENLGSLLRRIGRLPIERALRMGRELCVGLGAAHDQGVLHRDLKPANVMVDGLGHVRIMDFGIAVAKSDTATAGIAGTPAYMAPELFEGGEASVASDIYAFGVVLYEMVTGKLPHDAARGTDSSVVAALPAAMTETVTPQLERVIRRCLAPDPQDRPSSTYSVLAAIPGGDALAAAVAAGETPSPEMVAAAAEKPADRRSLIAMLVAAIMGLVAVFLLADQTMLLPRAGLEKPPAVLIDRAEELLKQLGHGSSLPGHASGFTIDQGYLDYVAKHREASRENLPCVYFWYRQGDRRLPPPPPLGGTTSPRRLPPVEGMNIVHLDGSGRLLRLAVYQRSTLAAPSKELSQTIDWSALFAAAELNLADYESVAPTSPPPMFADDVVAWKCRDASGLQPKRIEAAAAAGRVVFFDVVLPWEKTDSEAASQLLSTTTAPTFAALFWLRVITLLAALALAQYNLRLGRGDVRSARRLALFVFALALMDWVVGERHSSAFQEEASAALLWTSRATFMAAVAWFTYVAVEPYVRRLWPQTIVTWTRLIAGRFRDPLVGRDLLVGTVLGIALTLTDQLDIVLGKVVGDGAIVAKLPAAGYELGELLGLRYKIGTVISQMLWAVTFGMFMLLLLLILRIVFRDGRRGTVAFVAIITMVSGYWATIDNSVPWLLGLVMGIAVVLVLMRVGFVALAIGLFVQTLLMANPLTLHWAAWYAPAAVFAGLVPLTLASYGFYTARTP
jgi:eukaryotic-like serine/threonine-protein kinase